MNTGQMCGHRSLKDIHRIFLMPGGYQITFSFIPHEVYSIEMIQPKKQDTSELYRVEIELRKIKMIDFCNQAYPELKGKMQSLMDFMETEEKNYLQEIQEKPYQKTNILIFCDLLK